VYRCHEPYHAYLERYHEDDSDGADEDDDEDEDDEDEDDGNEGDDNKDIGIISIVTSIPSIHNQPRQYIHVSNRLPPVPRKLGNNLYLVSKFSNRSLYSR
jgi:hypothetical protein